jgi:hypothetical protein
VVGGAAEEALPAALERDVAQAGAALALVEGLGGAVEIEPATLDEEHVEAGAGELAGDGDAGGAGADHGDVGLQQGAILELGQGDEAPHRSAGSPGRRRPAVRVPAHATHPLRNRGSGTMLVALPSTLDGRRRAAP